MTGSRTVFHAHLPLALAAAFLTSSLACDLQESESPPPPPPIPEPEPPEPYDFEPLAEAIRAEASLWSIPGYAAAIVKGDEIFTMAEGVLSTQLTDEVTTATRFNLASITKTFTATLFMRLVDEGLVGIDSTIAEMVPDAALSQDPLTAQITLGQLLSHTSGLGFPDYLSDSFVMPAPTADQRARRRELFETSSFSRWVEPGMVWNYNNQVYSLLGYIAEELADEPFEQLLRSEVLEPLGMEATGYFGVNLDESAPVAWLNTYDGHSTQVYPPFAWGWQGVGHGGLWSSAEDMGRYTRALLQRPTEFLSEESWALLLDSQVIGTEGEGSDETWGYGFAHQNRGDTSLVGHAGGFYGVAANMTLSSADGVAGTALVNCDWGSPYALTQVVNGTLLGVPEFVPTEPDLSIYGEETYTFSSVVLGDFAMTASEGQMFVYFSDWDHFTEMVAYSERVFGFEMTTEMSIDVAEGEITWFMGVLFPAADGKRYFVSRSGVGVPTGD